MRKTCQIGGVVIRRGRPQADRAFEAVLPCASAHFEDSLAELTALVEIPSVSSDKEDRRPMHDAAEWLASRLRGASLPRVEVFPPVANPIVFAERLAPRRGPLPRHTEVPLGRKRGVWAKPHRRFHSRPQRALAVRFLLFRRRGDDRRAFADDRLWAPRPVELRHSSFRAGG